MNLSLHHRLLFFRSLYAKINKQDFAKILLRGLKRRGMVLVVPNSSDVASADSGWIQYHFEGIGTKWVGEGGGQV